MRETVGSPEGSGRRLAIVVARFNPLITEALLRGAIGALEGAGVSGDDIEVFRVPGAWELPAAAAKAIDLGRFDAILALGCVIRGATPHFDFVAGEAARGLGAIGRESRVPVLFGVLTTDTVEQAIERSGVGAGNKGAETALAALEMVDLFRRMV